MGTAAYENIAFAFLAFEHCFNNAFAESGNNGNHDVYRVPPTQSRINIIPVSKFTGARNYYGDLIGAYRGR